MEELFASSSFWGLVGVVVGFALGEGARYARYRFRIHRLKGVIDTELRSLLLQLDQKKEIVAKSIDNLKQKKYLPTQSIPSMTTAYKEFFGEVYEHFCPVQRNCIHNIYERVHLSDKILDSFERDFLTAIREKIIGDPFQTYCDRLGEVQETLNVAQELIRLYLEGNPKDIYGVNG